MCIVPLASAFFVALHSKGCRVRCWVCMLSELTCFLFEQLQSKMLGWHASDVTWQQAEPLCDCLRKHGMRITLESWEQLLYNAEGAASIFRCAQMIAGGAGIALIDFYFFRTWRERKYLRASTPRHSPPHAGFQKLLCLAVCTTASLTNLYITYSRHQTAATIP